MHVNAIRTRRAQLRARQSGSRRQFPPRAGQRHVRPQQHLCEGPGAGFQAERGHAGDESHHGARSRNWKTEGYEFEAAEGSLALLIGRTLKHREARRFTVDAYHVSMRRDDEESICEATVKVRGRWPELPTRWPRATAR